MIPRVTSNKNIFGLQRLELTMFALRTWVRFTATQNPGNTSLAWPTDTIIVDTAFNVKSIYVSQFLQISSHLLSSCADERTSFYYVAPLYCHKRKANFRGRIILLLQKGKIDSTRGQSFPMYSVGKTQALVRCQVPVHIENESRIWL